MTEFIKKSDNENFWNIYCDNISIGRFALYEVRNNMLELCAEIVPLEYRNKGIGTKIIRFITNIYGRDRNIHVTTSVKNIPCQALMKKAEMFGFKEIRKNKDCIYYLRVAGEIL